MPQIAWLLSLSFAEENGDCVAAMRHLRLSASGGLKLSMDSLIEYFENGILHHSDLAETLQAFYLARAELLSTDRDKFIEFLKVKGEEYKTNNYDC